MQEYVERGLIAYYAGLGILFLGVLTGRSWKAAYPGLGWIAEEIQDQILEKSAEHLAGGDGSGDQGESGSLAVPG